jgi:AcrR family transcriptional regulator
MAVDPHAAMLGRVVDHLLAGGSTDTSLRALAAEIGTSHRMLIYHFSSLEGLFAEVVDEVEARQRDALARVAVSGVSLADAADRFWRQVSAPALAPATRLFFALYARLLDHGQVDRAARLVEVWLAPAATVLTDAGVPRHRATALARLGLAVTRGLLLDLLATGDRGAVDAAMDTYIALAFPPSADVPSGT